MSNKDNKFDGEYFNMIGPVLKRIRIERNLSQAAFRDMCAEKGLHDSVATLSKIENRRRSVYDYELKIFAEVLNVPLDVFFN